MAYYVLKAGYELCGWDGLPFGLRHPNPYYTDFFDKETYRVVYAMDGAHDIDEESLTEKQKKVLARMKKLGIAVPASGEERIEPYQEYKKYPGMYKNHVQWSITGRCNYRCRHCFMSAPDYKGADLTKEQCVRILDELSVCGVRTVSLTGGEPLVSPYFLDILDEMKKRRMMLAVVYSNGKLVNERLLDELEKRKMHPDFHISFDGLGWHDWLRGTEGAEEAAVRAFRLCKERGFRTSTSICLHRHNYTALRENINFLASLGLQHIKMNVTTPTGLWKNETEHFITQDEVNEAILAYIPQYVEDGIPVSTQFAGFLEFNKERRVIRIPFKKYSGSEGADERFACGAVKEGLYISPEGKVLPCMTLAGTAIEPQFDSILEKDLSEILTDSFYKDMSKLKMGACIEHNEKCRDCKYRLACGAGCRACACGEAGTDYLGIDNATCEFYQHGWYEKALEVIDRYKDCFGKDTDTAEAAEDADSPDSVPETQE